MRRNHWEQEKGLEWHLSSWNNQEKCEVYVEVRKKWLDNKVDNKTEDEARTEQVQE